MAGRVLGRRILMRLAGGGGITAGTSSGGGGDSGGDRDSGPGWLAMSTGMRDIIGRSTHTTLIALTSTTSGCIPSLVGWCWDGWGGGNLLCLGTLPLRTHCTHTHHTLLWFPLDRFLLPGLGYSWRSDWESALCVESTLGEGPSLGRGHHHTDHAGHHPTPLSPVGSNAGLVGRQWLARGEGEEAAGEWVGLLVGVVGMDRLR